jgi:hypothetical protein
MGQGNNGHTASAFLRRGLANDSSSMLVHVLSRGEGVSGVPDHACADDAQQPAPNGESTKTPETSSLAENEKAQPQVPPVKFGLLLVMFAGANCTFVFPALPPVCRKSLVRHRFLSTGAVLSCKFC